MQCTGRDPTSPTGGMFSSKNARVHTLGAFGVKAGMGFRSDRWAFVRYRARRKSGGDLPMIPIFSAVRSFVLKDTTEIVVYLA